MRLSLLIFLSCFCLSLFAQSTAVFPFAKDAKWGIIDANKKVLVEPQYTLIEFFDAPTSDQARAKVRKGESFGVINRNGEAVVPIIYDKVYMNDRYYKNLIRVQKDNKMGLVDRASGAVVLPLDYDVVERFTFEDPDNPGGIAIIRKGDKYGAVNNEGKVIAATNYKKASVLDGNIVVLKDDAGKEKFLDSNGNSTTDPWANTTLEDVPPPPVPFENMELVDGKGNSKPTVDISSDGNTHLITVLAGAETISSNITGYSRIYKVVLDETKNPISIKYIMVVDEDDEIGIVDKDGNVLCPAEYQFIRLNRKNKTLEIRHNNLSGLADESGRLIYDAIFERYFFVKGTDYISVQLPNGYTGYADLEGNVFLPVE